MSDVAKMAVSQFAPLGDDSIQLSDLMGVLVASGDLFYEWDLRADHVAWLGHTDQVIGIHDTHNVACGDALLSRIHPEDLPHRMIALSRHFETGETFDREMRVRGDDGQFHWVRERAVAAVSPTGTPERLTGILRNISERKRSEDAVSFLTNHDALTGQYNRVRLREALEQAIRAAARRDQRGALLLVGLDKLNVVSDVYGEEVAEAIVLASARRIEDCLRSGDIVGRVGFDRFAVVVTSCTSHEAVLIASRFLAAIRDVAVSTQAGPMSVTASIGIAAFPEDGANARELVAHADTALRGARRLGCDCYLEYRDLPEQHRPRQPDLVIAEQVKQALRDNRFVLAFQPIVSSATGETVFYEALARMLDEDGNPVAAGGFVPVVEQMGMMRLVDRRVLELGLETLERNPGIQLSVNVSGMTAADPVWLQMLGDRLKQRPELAARLIMEITETVALDDIHDASRFVRTINEFGCRVALDDFGAGFTSFRHLRALNVAMVKIDGSFIRNLTENEENLLFVRTLVSLAKGIGLEAVAEWVETPEEAALLREEGIDYLQGWYCGKPAIDPEWLDR